MAETFWEIPVEKAVEADSLAGDWCPGKTLWFSLSREGKC